MEHHSGHNALFTIYIFYSIYYTLKYPALHIFSWNKCKKPWNPLYCWVKEGIYQGFSFPLCEVVFHGRFTIDRIVVLFVLVQNKQTHYLCISDKESMHVTIKCLEKMYWERIKQLGLFVEIIPTNYSFFSCFNSCVFGTDQYDVLYLVIIYIVQCNKLQLFFMTYGNFSKVAHYKYRQPIVLL